MKMDPIRTCVAYVHFKVYVTSAADAGEATAHRAKLNSRAASGKYLVSLVSLVSLVRLAIIWRSF